MRPPEKELAFLRTAEAGVALLPGPLMQTKTRGNLQPSRNQTPWYRVWSEQPAHEAVTPRPCHPLTPKEAQQRAVKEKMRYLCISPHVLRSSPPEGIHRDGTPSMSSRMTTLMRGLRSIRRTGGEETPEKTEESKQPTKGGAAANPRAEAYSLASPKTQRVPRGYGGIRTGNEGNVQALQERLKSSLMATYRHLLDKSRANRSRSGGTRKDRAKKARRRRSASRTSTSSA